jgi:hypothetical protein
MIMLKFPKIVANLAGVPTNFVFLYLHISLRPLGRARIVVIMILVAHFGLVRKSAKSIPLY